VDTPPPGDLEEGFPPPLNFRSSTRPMFSREVNPMFCVLLFGQVAVPFVTGKLVSFLRPSFERRVRFREMAPLLSISCNAIQCASRAGPSWAGRFLLPRPGYHGAFRFFPWYLLNGAPHLFTARGTPTTSQSICLLGTTSSELLAQCSRGF